MWIVCAVRKWALQNNFISQFLFSSYGLIWLVLFYLIAEKIVPSLKQLLKHKDSDEEKYVEGILTVYVKNYYLIQSDYQYCFYDTCTTITGWNCKFRKWSGGVKFITPHRLLLNFFKFYANTYLFKEHVLCTSTGKLIKKNNFFENFSRLAAVKDTKFKDFQQTVVLDFNSFCGLVLQDPFDLSLNITKNITISRLISFCKMCDITVAILLKAEEDNPSTNITQ